VKPVSVTARAILMMVLAALLGSHAPSRKPPIAVSSSWQATTNPRQLRAMQLLDQRAVGVAARVRFEWDGVAGARRYVLSGRWTSPPSWVIHSATYSVTPRNATAWESHRVAFELSLPEGTHSWSVVALFGTDEHGDFAHPTPVTFEVR